jgi:hypothetical protein
LPEILAGPRESDSWPCRPYLPAASPELIYNVDSSLVYKSLIAFQIRVGDVSRLWCRDTVPSLKAQTRFERPGFDESPAMAIRFFACEHRRRKRRQRK